MFQKIVKHKKEGDNNYTIVFEGDDNPVQNVSQVDFEVFKAEDILARHELSKTVQGHISHLISVSIRKYLQDNE